MLATVKTKSLTSIRIPLEIRQKTRAHTMPLLQLIPTSTQG